MYSIGNSFIILESVDSTNNYAMAKVHAGLAKHGDTYFSMTQTDGKGQRGKAWKSGTGENIILSCIIQPDMFLLNNPFILSMTIALSCYEFINRYTCWDTTIKWPNDIYWRDRKAGGILIENRIKGNEWQYAVIGIGLNINQTSFSPTLINPVSLKQVTGNTYNIINLAKELCNNIQNRLDINNKETILEEYNRHLYKSNKKVILKIKNSVFETFIKGVNSNGQLITYNKKEEIFNWGEVEWVK
jgi:BirA family biotin operon repressor/biotin-[acetyl-CoA-carboxylase] ligase